MDLHEAAGRGDLARVHAHLDDGAEVDPLGDLPAPEPPETEAGRCVPGSATST